jgi:predicted anti-sigma-YlaC factor YlaD
MNHLSEEQLILHYYGEESDAPGAEMHLDECAECRELYGSLQRVLNVVDTLPVPARSPEYGAEVWQRIERHLPSRHRWVFVGPWRWAAAAVALASLLVVAFLAGRFYP